MLLREKVLRFFNLLQKSEFHNLATVCDEWSAYVRLFKQMILNEQRPFYLENDSNVSSDPQNVYQYSQSWRYKFRENIVLNEIIPLLQNENDL